MLFYLLLPYIQGFNRFEEYHSLGGVCYEGVFSFDYVEVLIKRTHREGKAEDRGRQVAD